MATRKLSFLLFMLFGSTSFACDITLNPGNDVIAPAVNSAAAGDEVCLNAGTYNESNTIELKQGQTLRGLGTNSEDTIILGTDAYAVVQMAADATVRHFMIQGEGVYNPFDDTYTYPYLGVIAEYAPDSVIWDLHILLVRVPVSIMVSDNVAVWNLSTYYNAGGSNWQPDPSVWIYESDGVEILYGYFVGLSNGVGGDGEIACRDSAYLTISNVYLTHSGAAGMYFVNCDNATVEDSHILSGDEWGLDVQDGSSNFTATGNTINSNYWGAVIFDEADNGSGRFTGNSFTGNNTSGDVSCQGIVVFGNVSNVVQSGNYSSSGPAICAY